MSEPILTHDAGVSAFDGAGGVVQSTDEEGVQFSWDEQHIVRVDAPANLEGAFDTDRFYKIEGATIARPIKQPYLVGDDIKWYKKPADELDKAAWSFDNSPFTIDGHPESGMVKSVDDIHGFWRNPRYDWDEHRLKEDLFIPVSDEAAREWVEKHKDVSVGFYNRVHSDYDGNTGDLTDDDVDGFQVDMYGNHVAGVERGRCSSEHGCGLDGTEHGEVVADGPQPTHSAPDTTGEEASDSTESCGCQESNTDTQPMTDENDSPDDTPTIPDLSVDALAERNDAIQEVVEERDSLREDLDEYQEFEQEVEEALDSAENFTIEVEEDECLCDAVDELVSNLDDKVEEVEDLTSELTEYRQDEIEERLDRLEELGADREDWEETADEAEDPIEALDEEIDRREEVLDAVGEDVSVKDVDFSSDSEPDETTDDSDSKTVGGARKYERGHNA